MEARVNEVLITLTQDNPLNLTADALVVEAEPFLRLSAVQAALFGVDVQRELAKAGRVDAGDAVLTDGGTSAFRGVIHAVTPRWGEGSERGKLMNVTRACLALCEGAGLASVALPAFSVGQRGYPLESCASIMLTEIIDYTFEDLNFLSQVILYFETAMTYEAFSAELVRQLHTLADES